MSDADKGSAVRLRAPSTPQRVTFFEDRAEVTRKARAKLPAGVSWVALGGVSAAVDDPSVVAGIRGEGARVVAARVVRQVRQDPALTESEITAIEAAEAAARRTRQDAERAPSRARSYEARCAALCETWLMRVQQVPRAQPGSRSRPEAQPQAEAQTPSWRTAYGVLDQALRAALDQVSAATEALRAATEEEARASLRLQEGRRLVPRHETAVEVQVEAAAPGEVEIDLTYRVPAALWRPEHLAQLVPRADGKGHELILRTLAVAWQHTGEDWRAVPCRFSTARPAQSASPPLLSDDVLFSRKKTDAERRVVQVEAREQAIAVAGLDRGTRAVEEMPGVEDGGEPLWFSATRPADLPSDGQPVRVEIGEVRLPCEVDLVAYPEQTAAVHVRATASLTAPVPLLAGPVRLLRGSELVGRGRVAFVARGEPFELGFGVDDGLRVRRATEESRDTSLLGTQKVTRTVRLYVSNLSGSARRLLVTERVPVSEIEDLKVVIVATNGADRARIEERDGFVRFELSLDGGKARELTLTYRLEAAARVSLPVSF